MDKQQVLKILLAQLEENKQSSLKNYETYRQASVDAPGAMESHSDTSRVEFGNLADNIAREIENTDKLIKTLQQINNEKNNEIKLGSLVCVEENKRTSCFFIVPEGAGGLKIENSNTPIQTVSIDSLIGKQLLAKRVGEEIELNVPVGTRKLKILSIN